MAKSWLFAEDAGKLVKGELRLVFDRHEAAEMNNANAQQIMRTATYHYPEYVWNTVEVRHGVFIVEGDEKSKRTS